MVAPDSFKGSVSALGVAEAMERGIWRVFPDADVRKIPIADGGEGTVEALVSATGGCVRQIDVTGPMEERVTAHWGILGDGKTAVIEMAAASGLPSGRRSARSASGDDLWNGRTHARGARRGTAQNHHRHWRQRNE